MKKRNLLLKAPRVLVLDAYDSAVARNIISGVLAYARKLASWNVEVCVGHDDEDAYNRSMVHGRYDGMILGPRLIDAYRDTIARARCPIVLVDVMDETAARYGFLARAPMVNLDERTTVAVAGDFLLRNGHRAVAFIGEPHGSEWSRQRERLFAGFMRERGTEASILPTDDLDYKTDVRRLRDFLSKLPKPVSVFAASDPRAFTVARVCAEMQLSVPEDVSILGVDDDEMFCLGHSPALSSIRVDHADGGMKAAEELDALMRHKRRSERRKIWFSATGVAERGSTAPTGGEANPTAKRIREFIAANASEPINVDAVLSALKIPRRTAFRRFAAEYGRTIHDELRERRFAIALESMRLSPAPLAVVAERCGYASELHLRREMRSRGMHSVKELRGQTAP